MNPFKKSTKQTSMFITAGFPGLHSLEDQLEFIQDQGVDFIEIGIPFSDPLADGPVIQASSAVAIANGMTIEVLFEQLRKVRKNIQIPLVLMGYLNPVMQYGMERFLSVCDELDIKGLILPDLSYELYNGKYKPVFGNHNVKLCFLVTPKTEDERIVKIAELCRESFVYLVSQNSITGNALDMNAALKERYKAIRLLCDDTPLFLGFGIDSAQKRMAGFESCDGVIIGSAFLKALEKGTAPRFLAELGI